MRWQGDRQSENVEDRRGMGGTVAVGGGLGTVIFLLLVWLLGGDPLALLQQVNQGPPPGQGGPFMPGAPAEGPGIDDKQRAFVAVVLADTEDVWHEQFNRLRRPYRDPKLVLFSEATQSACGFAQSATGPFFCPEDDKVYLDTSFFHELEQRFHAPGDFAKAYVIAHEVGHHVQYMLGWSEQAHHLQERSSQRGANKLSVRLELQADYLAGVWAYHANRTKHILEAGDVEAALQAATAIGDDRLQREGRGYVVPDSFTHGTSAQRVRWFKRGLETGSLVEAEELFRLNESEL